MCVGSRCRGKPRVVEVGKDERERLNVPVRINDSSCYELNVATVLVFYLSTSEAGRGRGGMDARKREDSSLISALFQ